MAVSNNFLHRLSSLTTVSYILVGISQTSVGESFVGILYVVATPIGNLEDITLRALKVLRHVQLVAAEDTRNTRKLLSHYDLKVPMISYHEHNRAARIPFLLEALQTGDVALVSDAGTPGIADPGRELILEAVDRSVRVVPIPGPSAVTTAMAVAGLHASNFWFLGFLPRRKNQRRHALQEAADGTGTLVFFEAPHRLISTLEDMLAILGDRRIIVCRELTKVHEELFRGDISEAIIHFVEPRGEFTLIVKGRMPEAEEPDFIGAHNDLQHLKESGLKAKEAVTRVASGRNLSRREAYRIWIELQGD
jgi:16S rRNA (cytidine1402-2'-O)-methyltransferase